jgi:hypothetical protein
MEGHLDLVPVGLEDIAAQALGRGIADGMEQAVQSVPPLTEECGGGIQLARLRHIDLQDFGFDGQFPGRPFGEGQATPGSAEDNLGALLLGRPGNSEGERSVGQYAGDQDALSVQESHAPTGYCGRRHHWFRATG